MSEFGRVVSWVVAAVIYTLLGVATFDTVNTEQRHCLPNRSSTERAVTSIMVGAGWPLLVAVTGIATSVFNSHAFYCRYERIDPEAAASAN